MTTWGGGEQQIVYLMNHIEQNTEYKQLALCPAGSALAEALAERQLPHLTLPGKVFFGANWVWAVRKLVAAHKIKLVHTHDSKAHSYALLASVFCTDPELRLIVHRRVAVPLSPGAVTRLKYNHPRIAKIICVSSFVRQVTAPRISAQSKVCTIQSGIDLERLKRLNEKKIDSAQDLALPKDGMLVLNIGSLKPQKRQDLFVQMAHLMLQNETIRSMNPYFLIVGSGELQESLESQIRALGCGDRVRLAGFRKDAAALLSSSALLVQTSENEGLGNVIMEAFVANVPVVCSNSGGVVDLIESGVTGLLAQPGDARAFAEQCTRVLVDHALRDALTTAAAHKIKDFAIEVTAVRICSVYAEVRSGLQDQVKA